MIGNVRSYDVNLLPQLKLRRDGRHPRLLPRVGFPCVVGVALLWRDVPCSLANLNMCKCWGSYMSVGRALGLIR
ncbi:hypothetical protein M758_UG292400 [Ceratodon purpureus]|nr:hypothetical protein M758_UG292400 [Ceratodon purpureus]